jgi:hypothetical protein
MYEGGGHLVVTGGSEAAVTATPTAKDSYFCFAEKIRKYVPLIFSLTKEESSATLWSVLIAAMS